uniref:Uncharacterized protein n=1 Tax=Arundo donax TaxID=35708 RepID=A0A0A9BHY8_ARUDO
MNNSWKNPKAPLYNKLNSHKKESSVPTTSKRIREKKEHHNINDRKRSVQIFVQENH